MKAGSLALDGGGRLKLLPIFKLIEDDLAAVEERLLETVGFKYAPLGEAVRHLLQDGGKRIRPALAILSARLFQGKAFDYEKVLALAASVELLHTATLVHDDLIDSSFLRRGKPTLNAFWEDGVVVLAGDYLFSLAASLGARTEDPRIVSIFARTLETICDGELGRILGAGTWFATKDSYFQYIYSKTASLFATSTECGGILSQAPEGGVRALRDFGYHLGMAFQIVDDVLDFTGNEEELGKPIGSDLRQGTITLPTLYMLGEHPEAESLKERISAVDRKEEDVLTIIEMIKGSRAIEASREEAQGFAGKAKEALSSLPDNEYRRVMFQLADYVVERRR